jgi:hypothetical protein
MSREENDEYIEMLDSMAIGLVSDGSEEENWYSAATRPQNFFRKR